MLIAGRASSLRSSDGIADLELAPLRRLVWVRPGPFELAGTTEVAPQIAPPVCQGAIRGDQAQRRRNARRRHAGGDEDRRGVLGFRRAREFVRQMGRRGRPEVLALQLPQGPEQLTVTDLGPASKLLQEGGQKRVALQHIQRVRGSDHLPLLRIRELEGQKAASLRLGGSALKPDSCPVFNRLGRPVMISTRKLVRFFHAAAFPTDRLNPAIKPSRRFLGCRSLAGSQPAI